MINYDTHAVLHNAKRFGGDNKLEKLFYGEGKKSLLAGNRETDFENILSRAIWMAKKDEGFYSHAKMITRGSFMRECYGNLSRKEKKLMEIYSSKLEALKSKPNYQDKSEGFFSKVRKSLSEKLESFGENWVYVSKGARIAATCGLALIVGIPSILAYANTKQSEPADKPAPSAPASENSEESPEPVDLPKESLPAGYALYEDKEKIEEPLRHGLVGSMVRSRGPILYNRFIIKPNNEIVDTYFIGYRNGRTITSKEFGKGGWIKVVGPAEPVAKKASREKKKISLKSLHQELHAKKVSQNLSDLEIIG